MLQMYEDQPEIFVLESATDGLQLIDPQGMAGEFAFEAFDIEENSARLDGDTAVMIGSATAVTRN